MRGPLARFTRVIPLTLIALAAAGVVLAVVQLERWSALWGTAYGKVFLLKCGGLAALGALALLNRQVLAPAVAKGAPKAKPRLARSIAAEITVVVGIFAVVALWRFTPPPRAFASAETAFVHIHTPSAMAEVTIAPGRAGPVTATIRLMREDLTTFLAKEVTLNLSAPEAGIEPISRRARLLPTELWEVDGLILPRGGVWKVELQVLVTDFDRLTLPGLIVIEPPTRAD